MPAIVWLTLRNRRRRYARDGLWRWPIDRRRATRCTDCRRAAVSVVVGAASRRGGDLVVSSSRSSVAASVLGDGVTTSYDGHRSVVSRPVRVVQHQCGTRAVARLRVRRPSLDHSTARYTAKSLGLTRRIRVWTRLAAASLVCPRPSPVLLGRQKQKYWSVVTILNTRQTYLRGQV